MSIYPFQSQKRDRLLQKYFMRSDSLKPPLWLWMLVLGYIVIFSALSLLRHNTFHSGSFDLGIMSQVLWNTAHGRLFEVSLDRALDTELIGSYLGNHVRPILLLLAPFYYLWPDPRLLLILQSAALGLAAIPLFWIVRRELKNQWLQAGLVAAYLFYPALGFINLFDFHAEVFSVPLIFLAYWSLLEKRQGIFWLAIFLSLMTKESMVIPLTAFAVYCLAHPQWRKNGLWLLILVACWAILCFAVIIPYYNEGRSYRFFDYWLHLLSTHPSATSLSLPMGTELLSEKFKFVAHLLLPLGLLPLLGPALTAISLPYLLFLLLSSNPNLYSIQYHYATPLINWLFLASMHGLAKLESWNVERRKSIIALSALMLLAGTSAAAIKFNPVLFHSSAGNFVNLPDHEERRTALTLIPPNAGVASTNAFGPYLANRQILISPEHHPLPLRLDQLQAVDYVLIDLIGCQHLTKTLSSRDGYVEMASQILDSRQFGILYYSGRVLLLKRGLTAGLEMEAIKIRIQDLAMGSSC